MRKTVTLRAGAGAALLLCLGSHDAPAQAQSASEEGVNWTTCSFTAAGGAGTKIALFVFEPFPVAKNNPVHIIDRIFEEEVGVGTVIPGYRPKVFHDIDFYLWGCAAYSTKSDALSDFNKRKSRSFFKIIKTLAWRPSDEWLAKIAPQNKAAGTDQVKGSGTEIPGKHDAVEAAIRREQREAEFKAKLAAHEAQVADYQRKVKAREEEIARQQREHAAAQEAAAREKTSHARLVEEHMKRQMDYEAARNRHALCVNGDQKACAEIAAGKPATGEQIADAGEASTDTDANRCVTTAEVRTNATFQGNTSASVMNGCGQKVDVRICLMRTGGWNCGVVWGVEPQARASHSSFNATGEVFVDARVAGSSKRLGSP